MFSEIVFCLTNITVTWCWADVLMSLSSLSLVHLPAWTLEQCHLWIFHFSDNHHQPPLILDSPMTNSSLNVSLLQVGSASELNIWTEWIVVYDTCCNIKIDILYSTHKNYHNNWLLDDADEWLWTTTHSPLLMLDEKWSMGCPMSEWNQAYVCGNCAQVLEF